jgi:hypothetical protein
MKQTHQIEIRDRILSRQDLDRIAAIFAKQQSLARRSGRNAETSYEINFSDGTSIESDNADVLDEPLIMGPARPVQVSFRFADYSLHRHVRFSVTHGEGSYGNTAMASGDEAPWLTDTFQALKNAVESARPQSFWFRQHPGILLNLLALGIGCLVDMSIGLLVDAAILMGHFQKLFAAPSHSPWEQALSSAWPLLYLVLWVWRWTLGLIWGAFAARNWLLSLWPNIELDLGAEHLKVERAQRARLATVVALVVIPILVSLLHDIMVGAL